MTRPDQTVIFTLDEQRYGIPPGWWNGLSNTACEVRECTERMQTEAAEILQDLPFLAGVVKLPDGLILLQPPFPEQNQGREIHKLVVPHFSAMV